MSNAWTVVRFLPVALLISCATQPPQKSIESKAQYEFNRIVRTYQIPAAESTNAVERAALLHEAFLAYGALITNYPTARPWAARSLLAVAELHAERGDLAKALNAYDLIPTLYPDDEWEVIQAWRAAADLHWRARHYAPALERYFNIVRRFDRPGLSPAFAAHVRHARDRIREAEIANQR